ncbi:MAG: hypothetical protein DMF76_13055 [Acidobacteria bacterium]|nr:MAG: hypothetical protein DMF76_13055 [Acidobacteriota bacterium]
MKKVPAATVKKFENFIAKHSIKHLSLKELKDEKAADLLQLVEKKRKQHKDVVEVEEPEERAQGKVVDLVEVLKRSLARKQKAA